jgi:U3 small nucleolar RNA-associated protein 25
MAPYRGRGRGSFRGRGRGSAPRQTGKLARSGIRTQSGYRKFDSQRVKDVAQSDSEDEGQEEEHVEGHEEVSDEEEDEEVEIKPTVKAYAALMQSFQQPEEQNGRSRKRRRIEVEEHNESVGEELDGGAEDESDIEPDVEEEDEEHGAEEDDVEVAEHVQDEGADDAQEEEDSSDPFEKHFSGLAGEELTSRVKSIEANEWRTEKQAVSGIGNFAVSAPKNAHGSFVRKPTIRSTADVPLKKRLAETCKQHLSALDQEQQAIAPYVFNYTDVLVANRNADNCESLRTVACLHALNHVLKSRDKVLKNTARLSQSDNPETLELRDQGFTRPRVLILTETRQMALRYGDTIADLFRPDQQENKQRFHDSFTAPIDTDKSTMPADYLELFAGNNDNSFLTALKFTRKTLKYFAPFYTSDILLASPLGLRRLFEHEDKKKRDWDFLSSIELLIVDQADAMYMQNWTNVEVVLSHLNLQPRESHGTDINRIRLPYLDGHAKHLRQTLVLSAYITPEINRMFNAHMLNASGKAKLVPDYTASAAITAPSITGLAIKQTFSRYDSPSFTSDPDARFQYFTTAVLPSLLRLPKPPPTASGQTQGRGILIFIPTYHDFLRLRNYFATSPQTEHVSFGTIHDYTEVPDQRRARAHFLSGKHDFLLYTQRAHHFFRIKIRGVRRIVMYGVPDNPVFYEEVVGGYLGASITEVRVGETEAAVKSVFSKWDGLRLERVVGSQRVKGLLGGVGDTFDFV